MVLPVDDLLVRLVGVLRAERWIAHQTFEHDRTEGPPVALIRVALHQKDFRGDVVGCPNSRIGLERAKSSLKRLAQVQEPL